MFVTLGYAKKQWSCSLKEKPVAHNYIDLRSSRSRTTNYEITMLLHLFHSRRFKEAFWEWFDNLPQKERDKFKTYPNDMAELNFYNRVWRHERPEDSDI